MPSGSSAQAAPAYFEKLRPALDPMFERDDVLFSRFEKNGAGVEMVSPRQMRIDLTINPGGKGGTFSPASGDMGRGSMSSRAEANLTPHYERFAIEIDKEVVWATNSKEKAAENVAKREITLSMQQFRSYLEKLCQGAGDAVLANVSVVAGGGANLTLGTPYKAQLLYFNQTLTVYDATLAINRGQVDISALDYDAGTITVASSPVNGATLANIVATDLLLPENSLGANPVGLFGLKYHHSNASTGTWLNLNRATYPQIRTPRVNANSSGLVTSQVRIAQNKIRKALGINSLKSTKLEAYMPLEQIHAWEQLGITISQIIRKGGGGEQPVDLLFGQEAGEIGACPIMPSINADPTRIDFIDFSQWGRGVIQNVDFYTDEEGKTMFQKYGASGGIAAGYLFYYVVGMQIFMLNPRKGAFIDALTTPSGY